MHNHKFPLPKKYWVYITVLVVIGVLLFVNIFRTNSWTGDKKFGEFVKQDWIAFGIFVLEEVLLVAIMMFVAFKGGRIVIFNQKCIMEYYDQFKYQGINPGDYDYVWFDFNGDERALITKNGDTFTLCVQSFDIESELWSSVNSTTILNSLEAVKKFLYFDFEFIADENITVDKHGDEIYKEER